MIQAIHDAHRYWWRQWRVIFTCLAAFAVAACATCVPSPVLEGSNGDAVSNDEQALARFISNYRLASGDVLSIRVFGEPDLSLVGVRLTDSGTIFLPTIGELSVSGLRLGEVERIVVERLRGRILINPNVSISIEQYRPFFINGMVRNPGAYPFQPGLTMRKAISLAGGLHERASLRKMFVIRAGDSAQAMERVDYASIVLPGDVITIEESFF